MLPSKVQVLVIGGGPGGYVAAIRAAQMGLKPFVVEREALGGICLNHGCIPSKALIHASSLYRELQSAGGLGLRVKVEGIDASKLQGWKNGVVSHLRGGIESLFRSHGIPWVRGVASFTGPNKVLVETAGESGEVLFEKAVVATGSVASPLSSVPFDGQWVISYREALGLMEVPRELIIVGGGYIGLELGSHFARLGTKVTIVEFLPELLPFADPEAVSLVCKRLGELGCVILSNCQALGSQPKGARVSLLIKDRTTQQERALEADKILVAVGLKPNTTGLGLESAQVQLDERGFIKVDPQRRTSNSNVFAVGDITGAPALAHKAFMEGRVAGEALAGRATAFDQKAIPSVIFTEPEIAQVGLQEHEARARGIPIKVGVFPLSASGRAYTHNDTVGFAKVIADPKTGRLLGAVIAGAGAGDVIGEATLAIELGATAQDLALTIHPHPTMGEALAEAAEDVEGKSVDYSR